MRTRVGGVVRSGRQAWRRNLRAALVTALALPTTCVRFASSAGLNNSLLQSVAYANVVPVLVEAVASAPAAARV